MLLSAALVCSGKIHDGINLSVGSSKDYALDAIPYVGEQGVEENEDLLHEENYTI